MSNTWDEIQQFVWNLIAVIVTQIWDDLGGLYYEEKKEAQKVFRSSVNWDKIKVAREGAIADTLSFWKQACGDGEIPATVFSSFAKNYISLASRTDRHRAKVKNKKDQMALMMHEIMHVYQLENGVNVNIDSAGLNKTSYELKPDRIKKYSEIGSYNVEEQAQIVMFYWIITDAICDYLKVKKVKHYKYNSKGFYAVIHGEKKSRLLFDWEENLYTSTETKVSETNAIITTLDELVIGSPTYNYYSGYANNIKNDIDALKNLVKFVKQVYE
ncbi:MAG: hypothetical protein K0U39_01635 [Alphaproteobacteria bacterium]|nr:hypothetical protein [Alphaproteobacteria bacterium]